MPQKSLERVVTCARALEDRGAEDVDVEDSEVTLKGTVGSETERALAVEIAKNASEVKSVDDQLSVVESE